MHTIFSKAFYVPRNPTSLSAEGPENGQPGLSSEVFKTRYHTISLLYISVEVKSHIAEESRS